MLPVVDSAEFGVSERLPIYRLLLEHKRDLTQQSAFLTLLPVL